MSVVTLLGVNVLNNPAKFTDPYQFEITFECLEPLEKGKLLWRTRVSPTPDIANKTLTDLETPRS